MASEWFLHCSKCQSRFANCAELKLTLVGSTGIHVQLNERDDDSFEDIFAKIEHPDLAQRERYPYKISCRKCQTNVGVSAKNTVSFKAATVVFISRRTNQVQKWKKWSKAKNVLMTLGMNVENTSIRQQCGQPSLQLGLRRRQNEPLVFCDTVKTDAEAVSQLTRDTPRDYQRELFGKAMIQNTFVCLPTGCGKTLIAALAIACMTQLNPQKVAVFLAPRTPLVHQQFKYLKQQLPNLRIRCLTGDSGVDEVDKEPWQDMIAAFENQTIDVAVMTPQIFVNFVEDGEVLFNLSHVSVIAMDEAHYCMGGHPYAKIMKLYETVSNQLKPLILAMSASPIDTCDTDLIKIESKLDALFQRLCCTPIMPRETKQNLAKYWNKPTSCYVLKVLNTSQKFLESCLEDYVKNTVIQILKRLMNVGELDKHSVQSSMFKGILRNVLAEARTNRSLNGLAVAEHIMDILGVLELNTVLGFSEARRSMCDIFQRIEKAENPMDSIRRQMLGSSYYVAAGKVRQLRESRFLDISDRYQELVSALREFAEKVRRGDHKCRGIVFVKMRRTVTKLCEELKKDPLICNYLNPNRFMGHGKGTFGMSWREEQGPVLADFHSGRCKLLISTNVLEEGLDVPVCNLVIRFDSVMNLRAFVQSRGRAARRPGSKYLIMCSTVEEQNFCKEIDTKEKTIETVMESCQLFSTYSIVCRPGCTTRKLDASYKAVGERKDKRKKGKKIHTVVDVVVYDYDANDRGKRLTSAVNVLEKRYEVKSKVASQEETSLNLLPNRQQTFQSNEEFFHDVAQTWCQNGKSRNLWLRREPGRASKDRTLVHVVQANSFAAGDFQDRATFSQLWALDCQKGAEVVFLHDLKTMMILFYSQSSKLHRIEIAYEQLQQFVLVDTGGTAYALTDIYFSMRHVPKLSVATSKLPIGKQYGLDSFYDPLDTSEDEEDGGKTSDSETATTGSVCEDFSAVHIAAENTAVEYTADSVSDDEPEDDGHFTGDLSYFGFEPQLADEMANTKSWERRYKIEDTEYEFGQFFTLKITLPHTLDLNRALAEIANYGKDVCYAPVKLTGQIPLGETLRDFPHDVWYAHDCLINLHPNIRCRLTPVFYQLLRAIQPESCSSQLYQLSFACRRDYFTDPVYEIQKSITENRRAIMPLLVRSAPANCAIVKRLVFTPTRVVPLQPQIMEQNRVLRHFTATNFLSVCFREEDYSKLRGHNADLEEVLKRLKEYMKSGIVIGGERYEFVGCSNSQMRSHGCWFVRPGTEVNAESIRTWIGDLSNIRCVASYLSRLGLGFSTSTDALNMDLETLGVRWRIMDDVERGGYCFSDGVGTISVELAEQVCMRIGKRGVRSALQIRLGGCKGVLCVDPRLPAKHIRVRKSMNKFQSEHDRLEILQTSRAQATYLNHQIIMLLSNLGVPDEVFLKLQQEMLDSFAAMMLDEKEALQRLLNIVRIGIDYKALSALGLPFTTEPYFKSLLCALYKERIHGLLKKSRILLPVCSSRLLMGVMDETESLEQGEVFVQYSQMRCEDDDLTDVTECRVLERVVVVTRNPCLHPGDVRVLKAVDVPALHHLVDCVVFPSKGERPHPNEMAGGDLDGDLYFVSWDDDLLPRKKLFPPMSYPALEKKNKEEPIVVDDLVDFYMEYLEYDQLGVIDTSHKAIADLEGLESERCLRLAMAHSLAVDAPKTGKWLHRSIDDKPSVYPDFMREPTKPSYISHKVIGRLYRECRDFEEAMNYIDTKSTFKPDSALLYPGYEAYLDSAASAYNEYALQIKTVMDLYDIENEGEIMGNCFHKLRGEFGQERTQIADVVRAIMAETRSSFREKFFADFYETGRRLSVGEVSEQMKRKASAWYYHAYHLKPPSKGTTQFLSFPWLVDDILIAILNTQSPPYPSSHSPIIQEFAWSVHTMFVDQQQTLFDGYEARLELLDALSQPLRDTHYLILFGSSATMLFRPDSDLDLAMVSMRGRNQDLSKKQQIESLQQIHPIFHELVGKVYLVKDAKVPVLRITSIQSVDDTGTAQPISCDISADLNGFRKMFVLVTYYQHYPWLLPLLRVIILWAHGSGLTTKYEGFRINTNTLVFLFLSYCINKTYVGEINEDNFLNAQPARENANMVPIWQNLFQTIHLLNPITPQNFGDVLLGFFKSRYILDNAIPQCFHNLLGASRFTDLLNPDDIQILREQMQKAYHTVALHGKADTLLHISAIQCQRTFALSYSQSLAVSGSEKAYCEELASKSGASVSVRPKLAGSTRRVVLVARGPIATLRVLERVLNNEKDNPKHIVSAISNFFVRGSSMITFCGCNSNNDQLTFSPYRGRNHQTHDLQQRHVPYLAIRNQATTPFQETHAFQTFLRKFYDQILVVERDFDAVIHGQLEFIVHFGRIYCFDIPQALEEDSDPMVIEDLQFSAKKGVSTRNVNIPPRMNQEFRKPGGRGTARIQGSPRKKVKKKKRDKEHDRTTKHALFTVISDKCLRDIERLLSYHGFFRAQANSELSYLANTAVGRKPLNVIYDGELRPQMMKTPRLRWFLADVKCPWQQQGDQSDGVECDVRFILGTAHQFTDEEIKAAEYEEYWGVLKPNVSGVSGHPFVVDENMKKKLQLVRRKEKMVFKHLNGDVEAAISKVTEYSRYRSRNGNFKTVFDRYELVLQPRLPQNFDDREEVRRFLERIWKLALELASEAKVTWHIA